MKMKYLKLFEGYKEFSNSLNELNLKYKTDKSNLVDEYKSFIDDLLLDISDDYEVEFRRVIASLVGNLGDQSDVLLYNFYFSGDKIHDFFTKLKDVLITVKNVGISYTLRNLGDAEHEDIFSRSFNDLELVRDKSHEFYSKHNIPKFYLSISF